MTGDSVDPVDKLREIRNLLQKPDAPSRIDLRDYLAPGSGPWKAFVSARRIPGRNVKQATMVRWLDEVIGKLDGAVLDLEGSARIEQAPLPPPERAASLEPASPAAKVEPPSSQHSPLPNQAGTPLRQLTAAGIERAQEFLAKLRENPDRDHEPLHELLHDQRYSRPFSETVLVEPRVFLKRREAGEYLSQVLAPVHHRIVDHPGVWSWLGMYYFTGTAPEKLSPNNMTFLFETEANSAHATRLQQQRYRHYLWGSWRLYEQHAHHADFLLDQAISSWDDITERVSGSRRVFNSVGLVPLILRLYTAGPQKKRGHVGRPGGLRHLLRVLPQLELTYDVYGMEPEPLLEILPEAFRAWDRADATGP